MEIETFCWETNLRAQASLGCGPELRMDEDSSRPFATDGGHYTADCLFPPIPDPAVLGGEIKRIPGAWSAALRRPRPGGTEAIGT